MTSIEKSYRNIQDFENFAIFEGTEIIGTKIPFILSFYL